MFSQSFTANTESHSLVRPAYLPAIGTFQDGGLKHNNPVNLALWECRQIWPSVGKPDLVVSLGTGTDMTLKSPSAPNFRHLFKDGFIPRLYRSFMSVLGPLDGCSDQYWAKRIQYRLNHSRAFDEARDGLLKSMEAMLKKDMDADAEWIVVPRLPLRLVSPL